MSVPFRGRPALEQAPGLPCPYPETDQYGCLPLCLVPHTKATSKWVKRQTKTYDSETTRGQSHLALVQSKLLKKAVTAPKVTARPKSTEASAHRGSSAPVGVQPTALERIYQAFTAGLMVHNKKNSQFQIPKSN